MKPAANAPSTASSSNSAEMVTRKMSRNVVSRMSVCDDVFAFSVRKRYRRWPVLSAFVGSIAHSRQMARNAPSTSMVCQPVRVDSRMAMARIGPSSPHVPYEMMASPMGVPSRLRSLRIGMSVPSAVVVSAITVATPLMPCLVKNGRNVTTSQARPSVIPHVSSPTLP